MLLLLHGDDITASRNAYHQAKQSATNPLTFDGDKVQMTDLAQILSTGGLFLESQTVFIEQLFSKKKDTKELAAICTLLDMHEKDHMLVLWEGKDLTKKQLEYLKNATVRVYKLPQVLFTFLESIYPGNAMRSLKLFHDCLKTQEPEMLFFMLIRHLRILLALTDTASDIEEVRRIAPWQRGKLQKQSSQFSQQHLRSLYQKLAEIDHQYKTGGSPIPLSSAIDFFLLET